MYFFATAVVFATCIFVSHANSYQPDSFNTSSIPPDAIYLHYHGFPIPVIPSGAFSHLTQLETLRFERTETTEIEQDSFQGLSTLMWLDLSDNQLTEIQAGTFQGLSSLNTLYLSDNQFTEIQAETFQSLNALTDLNLKNNQLTEIQAETFQGLNSLTDLDLENNQLTEIQAGAFQNLSSLEDLDLEYNKLTQIQAGIFEGLSSLEILDLSYNQLTEIQAGTLQGLSSLRILDLAGNKLTQIQAGAFLGLSSLIRLVLSFNQLTQIQAGTFQGLGLLQILSLADNQLTEIQAGAFQGLSSLNELNLSNNNQTTLEWSIFDPMDFIEHEGHPELISLALSGNPLHCDEQMQWIKIGEQQEWIVWEVWNGFKPECENYDDGWDEITLPGNTTYTCSAGQRNNIGTLTCEDCGSGFYQHEENQLFCYPCPDDQCGPCPAGTFLNGNCSLCPIGTFNSIDNHILANCLSCPEGYTTDEPGSTGHYQCKVVLICSPGLYINTTTEDCHACPDGTYRPKASQESCEVCPADRPRTGGPGAELMSQCVSSEEDHLFFSLTLTNEVYDEQLENASSALSINMGNAITQPLEDALRGTRYFLGVSLIRFRRGSVITDLQAAFLNHPDAKCIFVEKLNTLHKTDLFPGVEFENVPCEAMFDINHIEPNFGPKAGGTPLTLHGENVQLHGKFDIEIGTTKCDVTALNDNSIACTVLPMPSDTTVNTAQPVRISWEDENVPDLDTGFTFTYKPDPEIEDINPNITFAGGGILIAVCGKNMDSVAEPIMVFIVTVGEHASVYYRACRVINNTCFECPTPAIEEIPIRRKRNVKKSARGSTRCEFEMKFHDYSDKSLVRVTEEEERIQIEFITDGSVNTEVFPLTVEDEPYFEPTPDILPFFTNGPCSNEYLHIKSDNLKPPWYLYRVTIGEESCVDEVAVTETSISCKPPKREPHSPDGRPMVKVLIGCRDYYMYELDYAGPFQCRTVQYITGGTIGSVLLVVVVVVACVKHKRKRPVKIQSVYPGFPTSIYPRMPESETGENTYVKGYHDPTPDRPQHDYDYPKSETYSDKTYAYATSENTRSSNPQSAQSYDYPYAGQNRTDHASDTSTGTSDATSGTSGSGYDLPNDKESSEPEKRKAGNRSVASTKDKTKPDGYLPPVPSTDSGGYLRPMPNSGSGVPHISDDPEAGQKNQPGSSKTNGHLKPISRGSSGKSGKDRNTKESRNQGSHNPQYDNNLKKREKKNSRHLYDNNDGKAEIPTPVARPISGGIPDPNRFPIKGRPGSLSNESAGRWKKMVKRADKERDQKQDSNSDKTEKPASRPASKVKP